MDSTEADEADQSELSEYSEQPTTEEQPTEAEPVTEDAGVGVSAAEDAVEIHAAGDGPNALPPQDNANERLEGGAAIDCRFACFEEPSVSETVEEKPLALLPPDHPLLEKFQQKLKEYLLRTKIGLQNEIAEIKYHHKLEEQQREEEGAKLYDLQQELQRQNEQLEEYTQEIEENSQKRRTMEEEVHRLKNEFDVKLKECKDIKQKYNKRMVELENMNTLEGNIRHWADEVEDEVKNAKRIVNRDTQLQKQLSEDKKKADMMFFHLDTEVKKKEKELDLVREEVTDMYRIIEVLKMSINHSNTDLEVLQEEHKRLTQAWSEVIVAIGHRDKILYQLRDATGKEQEFIKLCVCSIEAIKKQIQKELKQNEKLESFKTRLLNDFITLKRDCQKQSDTLAELEKKLEELPRFLEQTERDLLEANREGNNLEIEIRRIQWRIDKQYSKKFQIEENILRLAQDQLITDKASQYRLKLLNNAQEQRRNMELNLAQSQNQLSETLLEMERFHGTLIKMKQENTDLKSKLAAAESKSDHINMELNNTQNQIDLRLKRIDALSTRLDELQKGTQNVIDGTTQNKIRLLEKALQGAEQQIREHQQFWLMLQNHYVNLSQKRSSQLNEIQVTQKQLSIVKQKSLKIDFDLEKSEDATKDLDRDIHLFTAKLEILNEKMCKARQQHESEENECELEHIELVERLKENEMRVLNLESAISDLQNDIEHYKDLVLDKHRESLSWETKYKLVEETLRWRKSELSLSSEIGTMKTEIHRMQIRHHQLQRAQEKLLQDLQHGVMHREQIFNAASAKQRAEAKPQKSKTGTTVQQKVNDLRNKLKQMQTEISTLQDARLVAATNEHETIYQDIKRLRLQIEQETAKDEQLRQKIDECVLLKHLNLENIVRKQNRAKSYRKIGNMGFMPKITRSEATLHANMQKQVEVNETLQDLVQVLTTEFPEKNKFFAKISQVLRD